MPLITPPIAFPRWEKPDGTPLACTEKIKVLNENLAEIQQMLQDALEDGILMGACENQLRDVFHETVKTLMNPQQL